MAREDVIDAQSISEIIGAEKAASSEATPAGFEAAVSDWLSINNPAPGQLYHDALAAFEKPLIQHALTQTGGNQLRAARLLGINRNTLRKRINDLSIRPEDFAPFD